MKIFTPTTYVLGAIIALFSVSNVYSEELPHATPESQGMNSYVLKEIDDLLEREIDRGTMPGGTVIVTRNGNIVHEATAGTDKKYDSPDQIFRLFSQSKPCTALAVLMCVEKGLIELDAPVTNYIPEWKGAAIETAVSSNSAFRGMSVEPVTTPMTIRHLLTHTSGLAYGDGGNTDIDDLYQDRDVLDVYGISLEEMVKRLADIPLAYQPGTKWYYSLSFDVLGLIVQRVSKMPYDQFLKENIFDPLDMKDTGFYVPPEKLNRLATNTLSMFGRVSIEADPMSNPSEIPTLMSGGGGIMSTARDFTRLATVVANGGKFMGEQFISADLIKEMTTNQLSDDLMPYSLPTSPPFFNQGFGFGLAVQMDTGEASWGGAASTNWYVNPDLKTTFVGMTQRMPVLGVFGRIKTPVVPSIEEFQG